VASGCTVVAREDVVAADDDLAVGAGGTSRRRVDDAHVDARHGMADGAGTDLR
jgi:hypothetical protein